MPITNDDLCQLTRAIWESTLDLIVLPVSEPGFPERPAGMVTGRVQIVGTWLVTVLVECSEKLAKQAARAMFGLDAKEPTAEEVLDALAEITNVTGGNLKSLMSGECELSTPQVKECGLDPPFGPPNTVISSQAFRCQGEPLVVTLLEGQADSRADLATRGTAEGFDAI
jgi:chemotaxis protein CheX